MATTVTQVSDIIIDYDLMMQKQQFRKLTAKGENTRFAEHIKLQDGREFLHIINGLMDDGIDKAITPIKHFYFDGDVWMPTPAQILIKQGYFLESQGFDIYTQRGKYLRITVDNKIHFLDPVKDAAIIWSENEIFTTEEILDDTQEPPVSFSPKKYKSFNPKQYQLNAGILDAYNTMEMTVRQQQLDSIRERYPKVGETYPF